MPMPLTFKLATTEYMKQEESLRERQWPTVEAIIMLTPVIGIGHFTPRNIDEVCTRIRLMESLNGGFVRGKSGGLTNIPRWMIQSLVGLRTNVPEERWASFSRRIVNGWHGDQLHDLAQERRIEAMVARKETLMEEGRPA